MTGLKLAQFCSSGWLTFLLTFTATVNTDPHGRIRLSTDIRYQAKSDDIDKRWTNDWTPDDHL